MDSNIKITENILIFESINTSKNIEYSFVDDIGEFSKKYSLDLYECENTIHLDLLDTFFGNGIDSCMKIIFNISTNKKIDIYLNEINPFYTVHIFSDYNELVIELTCKSSLLNQETQDNKIILHNKENIQIILKKMISVDSKYYYNEQKLNVNDKCVSLKEIIKEIKSAGIRNQSWKLFAKMFDNKGNEIFVEIKLKELYNNNITELKKENIFYNSHYNSIVFQGLSNEKEIVVTKINDSDENIILVFNKSSEEMNLFLSIRNRQSNPFNFQQMKEFKPIQNIVIIPKSVLSKMWMKNGDNIELLIGKDFYSAKFVEFDESNLQKYKYFNLNNELSCKFYKNGRNAISIYIKEIAKNTNDKAIKIAVLGTCFSRNAFNSIDFFNPNYKKYFDCVYTQFHSTIGSLISIPAPNKCLELYEKSNDFKYIKTDMKKSFFEDLKLTNPDYLIIDLYADAMLQELKLVNNSIITYNYMIKDEFKIGDFVINWGERYQNEEEYFNNWKENIKLFVEKLSDIIPVENIILNRGRLSENYYNKNGDLVEFETKDLINRNNYYWERLDNIFLTEYPNINYIDLTDKKFHSVIDYPFGFSFSHYESKYYESFLNELMKIIFLRNIEKANL